MRRSKRKQIIPGFGLSMGITVTILSVIVLIPMASLAINAFSMGWSDFLKVVTSPRVVAGYRVSFGSAFVAAVVNAVFGVIV